MKKIEMFELIVDDSGMAVIRINNLVDSDDLTESILKIFLDAALTNGLKLEKSGYGYRGILSDESDADIYYIKVNK